MSNNSRQVSRYIQTYAIILHRYTAGIYSWLIILVSFALVSYCREIRLWPHFYRKFLDSIKTFEKVSIQFNSNETTNPAERVSSLKICKNFTLESVRENDATRRRIFETLMPTSIDRQVPIRTRIQVSTFQWVFSKSTSRYWFIKIRATIDWAGGQSLL